MFDEYEEILAGIHVSIMVFSIPILIILHYSFNISAGLLIGVWFLIVFGGSFLIIFPIYILIDLIVYIFMGMRIKYLLNVNTIKQQDKIVWVGNDNCNHCKYKKQDKKYNYDFCLMKVIQKNNKYKKYLEKQYNNKKEINISIKE